MLEDVVDIARGIKRQVCLEASNEEVDNSAAYNSYYVRGDDLSFIEDHIVRKVKKGIVTGPISVEKMHSLATEQIEAGNKVFFAALNE